jgi:hypothetical protein
MKPAGDEWITIISNKYWINKAGEIWNGKKCLKPWIHNGYYELTLNLEKNKKKHLPIHILLARSFIPNPLNKPCVDHINGNPLDNRLENLRWATMCENQANRKGVRAESGYKGVSMMPNGKYKVIVCAKKKKHYVGVFETAKEAHEAYCKKSIELHGEFHNPGSTPNPV